MKRKTLPLSLQNFILNAIKNDMSLAMIIATYHYSNLVEGGQTDPAIDALAVLFKPFYESTLKAEAQRQAALGQRKGKTKTVTELLQDLVPTFLDALDVVITPVYAKGSDEYVALFKDGRTPYNSGKISTKVGAVKQLDLQVGKDSLLTNANDLLHPWYLNLDAANTLQKGKVGAAKGLSKTEKKIIEKMAGQHFKNYGALIQMFGDDPEKLLQYIDYDNLKASRNTDNVNGTVNGTKVKMIWLHTGKDGETVDFTNSSTVDLVFYLGANRDSAYVSGGITIPAGKTITVLYSLLGDIIDRYLLVFNAALATDATYNVKLIAA